MRKEKEEKTVSPDESCRFQQKEMRIDQPRQGLTGLFFFLVSSLPFLSNRKKGKGEETTRRETPRAHFSFPFCFKETKEKRRRLLVSKMYTNASTGVISFYPHNGPRSNIPVIKIDLGPWRLKLNDAWTLGLSSSLSFFSLKRRKTGRRDHAMSTATSHFLSSFSFLSGERKEKREV